MRVKLKRAKLEQRLAQQEPKVPHEPQEPQGQMEPQEFQVLQEQQA